MASTAMQVPAQPARKLSSNNPYRLRVASQNREEQQQQQLAKEQQQSLDSEKQVVSIEEQDGAGNAPIPLDSETPTIPKPEPVREADKEVVSSWQSQSREENAPISMEYHESRSQPSGLLNEVKGPPPDYESLNGQESRDSDDMLTTPTSIEPDSPTSHVPPRPEDRSAVGQLLSWISPTSSSKAPSQTSPLAQPVVIPQLDVPPRGESVPFTRCYSDALASHDVSMRDFVAFLDGLAVSQAPNSALQGLKMFGAGVSFLPIPLVPLAGKGISALASSSSGHSGSRARLYLERAKKEFFKPRGLRLNIVKDNDLGPRLQLPAHASRLAPLTKNTLAYSLRDRRLEGVAPYVAPLRFDVPEPDKQIQGVQKLARKHLEHRFSSENKKITKLREDQWRDIEYSSQSFNSSRTSAGWDERYARKMAEIRTAQVELLREQRAGGEEGGNGHGSATGSEAEQALQEGQRRLQLLVSEREMAMQAKGSRAVEAEMEEVNGSRRLKWIVIENLQ